MINGVGRSARYVIGTRRKYGILRPDFSCSATRNSVPNLAGSGFDDGGTEQLPPDGDADAGADILSTRTLISGFLTSFMAAAEMAIFRWQATATARRCAAGS